MKKLALFLISILAVSCIKEPETMTKDYFLAQSRDPKIIGKWRLIHKDSSKKEIYYDVYHQSGELEEFLEEKKTRTEFFYTKGDRLYKLSPGSWKASPNVIENQYYIKNDTLRKAYVSENKVYDNFSIYVKVK